MNTNKCKLERNLSGSECQKIDAHSAPQTFRVGTGNPREKDAGRKGKRQRMIAREGVGEGEREEEREGDILRGLSPQTKNAGYVPV